MRERNQETLPLVDPGKITKMTTRIEARFAELAREGRAGLVTFVTAGDPDRRPRWRSSKALPRPAPT